MDDLRRLHPHGVFLRREALAAGYDDKLVYGALKAGAFARVRYGAYVDAEIWNVSTQTRRSQLRAHAAALTHRDPFAISHLTGASLHGIDLWGIDLDPIHITRPDPANGLRTSSVIYHQGPVDACTTVEGTPVLDPAICAVGTARLATVEAGVVALDSAYSKGLCSPDDVAEHYRLTRTWPGSARLQVTLRLAEPGSQSVGESRMCYLFFRYGLPKPILQYAVHDRGELVGIADFAWPDRQLLGEFDGRVKYGQLLKPGESVEDVVYREKVREDRLREATGWRMIRFSWSDFGRPHDTAERVRRALRG